MSHHLRLGAVSLDCPDPSLLAAFYADILGSEIAFDSDNFAAIKLSSLWLSFQKVNDFQRPTWPDSKVSKQFHLDLAVDNLDIAEKDAISKGAILAESQPDPSRWRVLIDPAGHPFCLSNQIPD